MRLVTRVWKHLCSPRFSYVEIFLIYVVVSTILAFAR